MTIEFRCTQCDKLLRVPAGSEGKKAKCPQCGNVLNIPDSSGPVIPEMSFRAPTPPPPRPTSDNPFQSPAAAEMRAEADNEIRKGFHPTRIDLAETLGTAWQIYKANFGKVVLGGLAVMLISAVISGAVAYGMRDMPFVARQVVSLAANVPSLWLTMGFLVFLLKVVRGENASFDLLFSGGRYLLPALGAFVIIYFGFLVGMILLIIPGIIFLLMFSQSLCILVDQNVGVIDSLRMSAQATRGNKLTLFALGLVTMVIVLLVTVLTCFIGYLFVAPFSWVVFITAYLAMTGQGIAVQR